MVATEKSEKKVLRFGFTWCSLSLMAGSNP
jgi:hypothetical protein